MDNFDKLKLENDSLRETCSVLSEKKVVSDIKKSLEEISKGKTYSLSDL